MTTDYSEVFDRTFGILVVLYGVTLLLGSLDIFSPKLVEMILPILVILGGLKITMKDMLGK